MSTSPLAMNVSTFEAVPPGAVPTKMTPMARSGGRANMWHRAKASRGMHTNWASRPSSRARGCEKTRLKSLRRRVMPIPNIIQPKSGVT